MSPFLRRLPADVGMFCAGDAPEVVRRYFELSVEIERATAVRDYPAAIAAARATFEIMPRVVPAMVAEFGAFNVKTCHAVHTGSTLLAVMGDRDGLRQLRNVLESVPELTVWLNTAAQAEADGDHVDGILAATKSRPGLSLMELKQELGTADGRRLSTLGVWLEKAQRLRRIKFGASYRFYPADYAIPTSDETSRSGPDLTQVGSSATSIAASTPPALRRIAERPMVAARLLELDGLPYVRLPRAPLRWEQRREPSFGRADGELAARSAPSRFAADGDAWQVTSEQKLSGVDRPDPAFKTMFATAGFTYWLDPRGRREGFPDAPAALRVTDSGGAYVGDRALAWDVYRSDVNTNGSAILFVSREGILHGYDAELQTLTARRISELPEYRAQATRLGIDDSDLRTRVRCVAISNDGSAYLVTFVDEAWCYSIAGDEVIWGLRFPTQEGWTRVAQPRSERTGTSDEVLEALRLLELELPVTPEAIARQYRTLAMRWHPDRNPGDPNATAQFQRLGAAMELVTGADLSSIREAELAQVGYEKILRRSVVDAGDGSGMTITLGLRMGELSAADWIYAANFGIEGHRSFLASYSGKVVEVTGDGVAVRVYDIGSVPRQILQTRNHLYILTDTRLYVLSGDRLEALLDVFEAGTLLVADAGFGLLQAKAFRWFTPTGRQVGQVRSKDPIRRVFPSEDGLVVETRQHRAHVAGAPAWWTSQGNLQ